MWFGFTYICFTLRSWVHETFQHLRTVSPRLGDNYESKCSSDSFPHTNYMSPCVENCRNYIALHCWFPIAGKSHEMENNYGTNPSHSFSCVSNLLPGIGENVKKVHGLRISEWKIYFFLFIDSSLWLSRWPTIVCASRIECKGQCYFLYQPVR